MRLLAAMVAAFVCSPAIAADYLGKVLAVSDGDTFTMEADGAKVRVRICGIDAPERGQAGYGQAAGVLSSMIEGKTFGLVTVWQPRCANQSAHNFGACLTGGNDQPWGSR